MVMHVTEYVNGWPSVRFSTVLQRSWVSPVGRRGTRRKGSCARDVRSTSAGTQPSICAPH